jgi:hypothetical protein
MVALDSSDLRYEPSNNLCEGSSEPISLVYLEQLSTFGFLNKMLLHPDRELVTFAMHCRYAYVKLLAKKDSISCVTARNILAWC